MVTADISENLVQTGNLSIDTPSVQIQNSDVPIGILVMKSGFVADIGEEYLRAFELALNNSPDSPIRPMIMDGGSEPTKAISSWKEMKESKPEIPTVITVASWTSNVVYPEASDMGIVQVALGSAAINQSSSSDRLIRFTPGVAQESPVLASYLNKFDRIAVIGGDNDYSNGYFSTLDALLPGKIILNIRYNQDSVETTLNYSEIIESNPDVIVLLSVSEGGEVIRLLREHNITTPFVGTRVIERNSLTEINSADGLIFTSPALNTSHPFFNQYFEKYGENSTFYGAEGYDAMSMLSSAVSECGDSSKCLYSWFENRTYNGTLGRVVFDDMGVASYPIAMKIVKDGKFEEYRE
ncbi:branched-chain amino acid ABC transporter substrate-binding protein [Methanospirillum stamsii]|uniref:Branched-chain amino acid ABC transporter substrate-binding protein n=2 Tax=Methanospirillum stamsii TaxID=1277351 RepID=A0A2V2N4Q3_9EURY|nr:branched-chain amino acid ABC transporter substrate-binding protein [Methanospirillum stamsii]